MPGIKRARPSEDDVDSGVENVHPSRKQRLDDGNADAELRKIFNELRDEILTTRLDATRKLLKTLSAKSDKQAYNLDYSITRLIKGVCSGAKAARPGFSIALVEVLRLGFALDLEVTNVVDKALALTNPDSKASGDEKRNHLIGRRFAFQAILQSGVLSKASETDAKYLFEAVADLAKQKDWLRSEVGAMLHEFFMSQEGKLLPNETVRTLVDSWAAQSLLKSPEGVALWLTIKKTHADVKLPKGIWNHNNPLSSQERGTLTAILLKNAVQVDEETNGTTKKKASGTRQATPSFAWQVILTYLYEEEGGKKFSAFWDECVAKAMFSSTSSTERRSLGLQIFTKALASAPAGFLEHVIHSNIIQCIIDQRAKPDRFLFEAAKVPLNQMTKRVKEEPVAASPILCKLFVVLPGSFDKFTKTTIEAILASADADSLEDIVATVVSLCRTPGVEDPNEAEKRRRVLADALLSIVRSRRSEPSLYFAEESTNELADWLQALLKSLTHLGYTTPNEKSLPPLTDGSRAVFRERLMSSLGHLVDLPLKQATAAPSRVVETLHESKKLLSEELSEQSSASLKDARKHLKDASKKAKNSEGSTSTVMRAFQLLLALGMLQVYKQEPDSIGVLEDISSCYQSPKDSDDASTMIIELLLSFVSKPSALFRKLAEQVFSAFAPEVSADGLQSMIDILSQKESLTGQQELFKEDQEDDDEDSASDEEGIDVEDASDIEITNGEIADDNASASSSDSEDSSSSPADDSSEEAAFDAKLAAALGTTGMETGDANSFDSDSDMDDEQMLALEPHLTTIFAERKKTVSQKQENKSAKTNMTNFKNRVLDLLQIYVKSQHASPIALNLLHPLVSLVRTTSNQPTAKKAYEVLEMLFDTCKKQKALPEIESSKPIFELLKAVFEEMRLGGSKLHASACSRSAQFLAKLLVAKDSKHWKKVAGMYVELQDEWRQDPKSRIHGSVFNEWHSWSMQK